MKRNINKDTTVVFKRWSRKGWGVLASLHRHVTIGQLSVSMSIVLLTTSFSTALAESVDSTRVLQSAAIKAARQTQQRSLGTVTSAWNRLAGNAAPAGTAESVLRLCPAVDVRERGGQASQADIHLRGGSADQTQVMLNGIDFTDARTGHQSHGLPIDLDAVGEIVLIDDIPGLGSFAGTVNFRTIPLEPNYLRLETYGGGLANDNFGVQPNYHKPVGAMYGTSVSGAGTYAGKRGELMAFGAGSYRASQGYRYNTDYENGNVYARLIWASHKAGTLDAQGGWQKRAFGSNGFYAAYNPDQWERTETGLASIKWTWSKHDFAVGVNASYRKNFDRYDWTRGTAMNYHETDNVGAGLEMRLNSVAGATTLGADWKWNHIWSSNLGKPMEEPWGNYKCEDARHTGNVWLGHKWSDNQWSVSATAGAGLSPYGNRFLWSLGVGWRPVTGLSFEAGAVQSTRLPTFTDLYYTSPAQVNNLDLVPEDAITVRLNGAYSSGAWIARLGAYYRFGRNIIDWVWHDEGAYAGKWHSEQSSRLGTFGLEASASYQPKGTVIQRIAFGYAFIKSSQQEDVISKNAMDYMRNKATLEVLLRFPYGFHLGVTGGVYDRAGNYNFYPVAGDSSQFEVCKYEPFGLLDARFSWTWRWLQIYLDGTNLTDTRYADIGGLTMPGIAFRVGCVLTV